MAHLLNTLCCVLVGKCVISSPVYSSCFIKSVHCWCFFCRNVTCMAYVWIYAKNLWQRICMHFRRTLYWWGYHIMVQFEYGGYFRRETIVWTIFDCSWLGESGVWELWHVFITRGWIINLLSANFSYGQCLDIDVLQIRLTHTSTFTWRNPTILHCFVCFL